MGKVWLQCPQSWLWMHVFLSTHVRWEVGPVSVLPNILNSLSKGVSQEKAEKLMCVTSNYCLIISWVENEGQSLPENYLWKFRYLLFPALQKSYLPIWSLVKRRESPLSFGLKTPHKATSQWLYKTNILTIFIFLPILVGIGIGSKENIQVLGLFFFPSCMHHIKYTLYWSMFNFHAIEYTSLKREIEFWQMFILL